MTHHSAVAGAEAIKNSRSLAQKLVLFIASGFGSGYSLFASGTVATAVAIPFYFLLFHWLNRPTLPCILGYLGLLALLFFASIPAATEAENVLHEKDPHFVTIDEIIGFFASMFLVPESWQSILAAFFIFRLFDVWKPYPIRQLQALRGGMGIMIDDLLAGFYTCAVLQILFRIIWK